MGVNLHVAYALLIEKFGVVAGIAEQEVICTYSRPEEAYQAVGLLRSVIHVGDEGARERTVGAEVGKLVQIVQSVGQSLVSTA